jgi:hypothetical protein
VGKVLIFFKFHGVQSRVIVIASFVLFSLVPNTNINFSDITVDKNWAPEEPHKENRISKSATEVKNLRILFFGRFLIQVLNQNGGGSFFILHITSRKEKPYLEQPLQTKNIEFSTKSGRSTIIYH